MLELVISNYSLEYWIEDNWYVGRLKEVPGVFSQGETFEELTENNRDAYKLVQKAESETYPDSRIQDIAIEIA